MTRKLGILGVAVWLGTLFSAGALYAQVDPTTIIEVGDGNTAPNGSPNCDWDTLNGSSNVNHNTVANPCGGASATINAYTFLTGDSNEKNFTTGGSKDGHDTSDWKWSIGSTPDKDTLTHAYAVSYTAAGHKILAFGGERFAVNGDANIGVWFFKQPVGPEGTGKGGFTGVHSVGDVFAVSAFTNGGGHPGLDVYGWNPACSASNYGGTPTSTYNGGSVPSSCADTNLELRFSGATNSTNLCSGDPGCTAVNGTTFSPAWPYASKFTPGVTTVPLNGFFEGGFDLTAIFGGSQGCFSSFLMETRSSQAVSAVLKDFLSGSFPECKIEVKKDCQCTAFSASGGDYTYQAGGTIENQGGPVFGVQVVDRGLTFTCGDMAANTTKNWGSKATGANDCTGSYTFTDPNQPTTNTATATAHTTSDTNSTQNIIGDSSDQVTCTENKDANGRGLCTPRPELTLDKQCVTTLEERAGLVVVRVDYVGVVTNNGNVNLNEVIVDDKVGGILTQSFNVGTLAANGGSKCYTNAGVGTTCPTLSVPHTVNQSTPTFAKSYNPTTLSNATVGHSVDPGRAEFFDVVRATGTTVFNVPVESHAPGSGVSASCLVCPNGFCPAP